MLHIFGHANQLAEDAVGIHTGNQFIDDTLRLAIVKVTTLEGKSLKKCTSGVPKSACPSQFHHMQFLAEGTDFCQRFF